MYSVRYVSRALPGARLLVRRGLPTLDAAADIARLVLRNFDRHGCPVEVVDAAGEVVAEFPPAAGAPGDDERGL